jgi:hypothetical protein
MKREDEVREYHRHMQDIGELHCGVELAYTSKFNLGHSYLPQRLSHRSPRVFHSELRH